MPSFRWIARFDLKS